ncbi:MAG: tetratricopeptide repeat protein [Candidatus Magnetobacterium sp. LHC-1]
MVWAEEQSAITLIHKSGESVAAGDLDAALQYADKAIGVDPAYYGAWKQHGRVLMLKDNHAAAITSLEKALKLQGDDTTVEWLLNSLIALNRFGDVLERLKSVKKDILSTKRYVYIYNALLEGAKDDEVLRFSTHLELAQSTTVIGRVSAAITKVIRNDSSGAQTTLSAIKASDEDERTAIAVGWGYVGKKAFDAGDFKGAIEPFKRALVLYPKWGSALRQLGWAYRLNGEPLLAVASWQEGLTRDEAQVSWLGWIAEAYLDAGKTLEAATVIDRLLKLNPTHERRRILKVMFILKTGTEVQKKAIEATLKAAAKDNLYVLNMGYSLYYMSEKLFDKAAVVLERLHDMRPEDKDITKRLIEAYTGWVAALNKASGDSTEVSDTGAVGKDDSTTRMLTLLNKLVALDPERPGVWRDMGWALWVSGQHNEAIEAWQKALNLGISDSDAMVLQVLSAIAESGNHKEALELYVKWYPGAGFLPFGIRLLEARRTLAAAPFLEAAFEKKEDPPVSGLYLANVNARKGICVSLHDNLDPFIKRGMDRATNEETNTLMATADLCLFDLNIASLLNILDSQVGKDSAFFDDITKLMEKAAKQYYDSHNTDEALNLYRRVIKRNPTEPIVWLYASNAATTKSIMSEADSILEQALAHDLPPFIKQRALGKREELQGNTTAAIDYYKKSIELEPAQPDLRTGLFKMLYAQDRFTEANEELRWVEGRIEAGETSLRVHITDMYTVMGYTSKALDMWNVLMIAYPETPYFAVEAARGLFQTCKADKAIEILKGVLETKPNEAAFTLYIDILQSLGQNEKIMELTTEGIKNYPKSETLLRSRAEAAEVLRMTQEARQTAQDMLAIDNSNPEMSRLAARSIVDAGLTKEGRTYYESLLKRNPSFLPALTALRNITSSQQDTSQAVEYARMVVQQRPWDMAVSIRYATSLTEDQDFTGAYKILRRHISTEVTNAVPVLLYSNVTTCNYNGRISTNQVITHLRRLKAEGFEFITPDNLSWPSKTSRAIVVIANAEMDALKAIDTELQKLDGRAVYADNMDILLRVVMHE